MGIKLTGNDKKFDPTPVVGITQKEGGKFVGILADTGKEVQLKRYKKYVYNFKIEDTDMSIQIKKDDEYVDTDVKAGQLVSVFAPTVLRKALMKAEVGQRIQIIYLGKQEGKDGGADYHGFDVEVL